MFQRLFETTPVWMTVPLRIALGLVFIAHGAQKVFGVWGGPGFAKFTAGEAPWGLSPSWFWLGAAAISELVGGVLVLLGLATRLGALLIIPVMIVAIFAVHWPNGFLLQNGGYEFAFVLLCIALSLLIAGGGRASIDEKLAMPRRRRRLY